jgi:bisphosphoglycerate-independent phosphoglycerate mutase (AlkP superfamily)
MISFNFRKDRPREIVSALASNSFGGFDRGTAPIFSMTTMMPYDQHSTAMAAGSILVKAHDKLNCYTTPQPKRARRGIS